jgi:hypothetical protein
MGWRGRHTFTSGKIRCDRRSHEGRPHRDFSATQGRLTASFAVVYLRRADSSPAE